MRDYYFNHQQKEALASLNYSCQLFVTTTRKVRTQKGHKTNNNNNKSLEETVGLSGQRRGKGKVLSPLNCRPWEDSDNDQASSISFPGTMRRSRGQGTSSEVTLLCCMQSLSMDLQIDMVPTVIPIPQTELESGCGVWPSPTRETRVELQVSTQLPPKSVDFQLQTATEVELFSRGKALLLEDSL